MAIKNGRVNFMRSNRSSAVAEKRRHAECALVYRHLWPSSIQPQAKTIVVCVRLCMVQFRNRQVPSD